MTVIGSTLGPYRILDKLLDFGLAKRAVSPEGSHAAHTQALTSQGQTLGTLQYLSPGGEPQSATSRSRPRHDQRPVRGYADRPRRDHEDKALRAAMR